MPCSKGTLSLQDIRKKTVGAIRSFAKVFWKFYIQPRVLWNNRNLAGTTRFLLVQPESTSKCTTRSSIPKRIKEMFPLLQQLSLLPSRAKVHQENYLPIRFFLNPLAQAKKVRETSKSHSSMSIVGSTTSTLEVTNSRLVNVGIFNEIKFPFLNNSTHRQVRQLVWVDRFLNTLGTVWKISPIY